MGVKFGKEERTQGPLLRTNFTPVGATVGYKTSKTEIFTEN